MFFVQKYTTHVGSLLSFTFSTDPTMKYDQKRH